MIIHNQLTCDDVNVRADRLSPRRQAGVVARVPRAGARHQQLGRRPRPALLRLQADAAARRVKVQYLKVKSLGASIYDVRTRGERGSGKSGQIKGQ